MAPQAVPQPPHPPHPIARRFRAENLVRRRRADEEERYAASQRRGRIDPNPHQIDAVIFALRRIPEGGCILGDEVGLGKTIEAGLVIAQLQAEGARRILVILPKPLLGQWQSELFTLFGMEALEGRMEDGGFDGGGVFLVGRESAGSVRGSRLLQKAQPFDLCVIDEAHEIFAGIYRRYDSTGRYKADADVAVTAHRVRSFLGNTPVLLLTATPMQNSLTELWGLVQYVEPTGTLLGDLPTFRQLFIEGDDRKLMPGQHHELRRRLATVCQRTLRRQAQEFLKRPFVERRTRLFEYRMSHEERELYDDVTAYLLETDLCAFRGRQRRLLLIGFHRRMASSVRALAASLGKVAERLRRQLAGDDAGTQDETADVFLADLEDDELAHLLGDDEAPGEDSTTSTAPQPADPQQVRRELERVEDFIRRARELPQDSKAAALVSAVDQILGSRRQVAGRDAPGDRVAGGKVVIFTESLTTQDYLQETLLAHGLEPGDITLFRGNNDSPRAAEALERWQSEVGETLPWENRPSRSLAVRLALVHEFKHRSRVFIATEAGAKGLNLQFCDSLINYDLPWNPQRIEQRIGRCHRYSQERAVTVINFLARDNETQRLTFEILSQKLDLFGKVLDASDHVLYEPRTDAPEALATALGLDFESELNRIYRSARTIEEVEGDLRELRATLDAKREAFEERMRHTAELIETHLDEKVQQMLRIKKDLPRSLARLDHDIDLLVRGYLDARRISYRRSRQDERILLNLAASSELPESLKRGARLVVGHARDLEDADPLHLSHPLVKAAVEEARDATRAPFRVRFPLASLEPGEGSSAPQGPSSDRNADAAGPALLLERRGERGRLVLTRITYAGFETVDHLQVTVLLEGDEAPLPPAAAQALLQVPAEDLPRLDPPLALTDAEIDDAVEEGIFLDQARVAEEEQVRFERMMEQIECYVEDQMLVLRRRRQELEAKLQRAGRSRDAAMGAEARKRTEQEMARLEDGLERLTADMARLESRQDPDYEKWRRAAHKRRYTAPTSERLLDVEFVLA